MSEVITPEEIRANRAVVGPYLRRTPVVDVDLRHLHPVESSEAAPATVRLKLEQLQVSGSFKARGAFTNLLTRKIPPAGVIAASGGNHGVAVAYAAQRLGVRARIFVPTISDPVKIERIRRSGAELVVGGDRYADALGAADEAALASGALTVHAFDQRETLLGQGSLAVELADQVPDLDTVLVPVGGGGLIGGIAAYFAGTVRVIGVEPDGAPTLARAREWGAPVDAPTGSVAADALAPRRIGELVFPITRAYVEDVVLVDDESILAAQATLWENLRLIAEPAASVAVAALASGVYRPDPGERVAALVTGANTAPGGEPRPVG